MDKIFYPGSPATKVLNVAAPIAGWGIWAFIITEDLGSRNFWILFLIPLALHPYKTKLSANVVFALAVGFTVSGIYLLALDNNVAFLLFIGSLIMGIRLGGFMPTDKRDGPSDPR